MVSEIVGDRLIVAAPTPIRADQSLDLDAFALMVDSDISRGTEGIYVAGSSGEGLLLSTDERMALTRAAVEAAGGRVPVYAHVGAMSTCEAISLGAAARESGAAAISMIPPLYYKYSTAEVVDHFRSVIDAVDIPFILYNIPQFTGRDVSDGGFEEVLELSQVVGIKHTSQNLYGAERLIQRYPHLALINGFDELYLPALSVGAKGAIGTTVGLQIELFRSLRSRHARGDVEGARTAQRRINDTVQALVEEGIFAAAKYLAGKHSTPLGTCRRPLPGLEADARRRLDVVWDRLREYVHSTLTEDAAI